MLLKTITVDNYGLFHGRQCIDVAPRKKYGKTRPVILFGGKNGSGKTTIQEAVRLCLYGASILGNRVSRREYESFLAERIHRADALLLKAPSAAVTLEFDYVQACERDSYTVTRAWERRGSGVKESLSVLRNGKPIDDCDQEHWHDFLKSLIPPGVSQFFIFDGEKIQDLAEDSRDDSGLAESIKSLLGIDLVETLAADIRIFLARSAKGTHAESFRRELEDIEASISHLEARIRVTREEQASLQGKTDQVNARLEDAERRLAREGAGFAKDRDRLKDERARLEAEISHYNQQLREMCAGLLPFAFAPQLLRDLCKQLAAEDRAHQMTVARSILEPKIQAARSRIAARDFLADVPGTLSAKQKSAVRQTMAMLLAAFETSDTESGSNGPLVHALSADVRHKVERWARAALDEVPRSLGELAAKLEQATRKRRKLESQLGQVPDDAVLHPLLSEIAAANRELGGLQSAMSEQEQKASRLESEKQQLENRRAKLQEQMTKFGRQEKAIDNARAVQGVLADYGRELITTRVASLRANIAQCFARLCRKNDLVKRIEIDPATFHVSLFDRHGRTIPKHQLSAGEKQIFAISVLWGLGQASGRPLPLIIDTPLGRLDRDHRNHLLTRYFPNASHQVLILSTDTEIDQEYFDELAPSVSHAYRIDYDEATGGSDVRPGYFWESRERVSDAG